MKIVHLSVCRQFSQGQINQLRYENDASKKIKNVEWHTQGYHVGAAIGSSISQIPLCFRPIFLRNLWGWIVALRLSRQYDVLIMRHMTFDPFALMFSPLINNRVSVHHAKEVEELKLIRKGWRGKLASLVERCTGRVAVRNAKMILGVTEEIARYEAAMRAPSKPIGIYPNGIEVDLVSQLSDERKSTEIHVAFLCGTFSAWHGLDKLIHAIDRQETDSKACSLQIHLIGRLSNDDLSEISATSRRSQVFHAYGVMTSTQYMEILAKCDFGIGSLALERQGLTEAATLKIREMLAIGLPVYSGHKDMALANDYAWGRVVDEVRADSLIEFGMAMKDMPREKVRHESARFIEKKSIMECAINSMERVFENGFS